MKKWIRSTIYRLQVKIAQILPQQKVFGVCQVRPLILGLVFFGTLAHSAESFEIPGEELRSDVVLPKFDRFPMVMRPHVRFAERWEAGIFGAAQFTEPIFNPLRYGLELGYHFKESHSFHASIASWQSGLNSQYVPGIEAQGGTGNQKYQMSRVPAPKMSYWGYYHFKAYYGKISLSKKDVMNLSLYTQFGLGMTQFAHKSYPGLSVGIGQRFYFTPQLAVKLEAKLQYLGMVDPFLGGGKLKEVNPVPSPSEFSDLYRFATLVEGGLLWLF